VNLSIAEIHGFEEDAVEIRMLKKVKSFFKERSTCTYILKGDEAKRSISFREKF